MSFRNLPRARGFAQPTPSRKIVSREVIDVAGRQVTVLRKNNRNMYLRVRPPYGQIEVSAPQRMPRRTIEQFVTERADWIDGAQRKMAQSRADAGRPDISGESFTWNEDLERKARENLEEAVPRLLERWVPRVGKAPTDVTLRKMTSRWGSCTPKTGRIRLNLQLGLMDEELLEYVVVHELTHLWEHGHGEGFQNRMTMLLPNWKQLRTRLNKELILR